MHDETVNVRYMVDDVASAIDFYTSHLGFTVRTSALPAFADVTRGHLRLLLSGPESSAGRPMPDGAKPTSGGWNRIHLITADLVGRVATLPIGRVGGAPAPPPAAPFTPPASCHPGVAPASTTPPPRADSLPATR